MWDSESGRALATLEGHSAVVTACVATPDDRRMVSASWDQTLKILDVDSGVSLYVSRISDSSAGGQR